MKKTGGQKSRWTVPLRTEKKSDLLSIASSPATSSFVPSPRFVSLLHFFVVVSLSVTPPFLRFILLYHFFCPFILLRVTPPLRLSFCFTVTCVTPPLLLSLRLASSHTNTSLSIRLALCHSTTSFVPSCPFTNLFVHSLHIVSCHSSTVCYHFTSTVHGCSNRN